MNRVYSSKQWAADFQKSFAPFVSTQARGALLAADNDEPEPVRSDFTSRKATPEEIEANRREERIAGFDSSPWGVS